MEPRGRGRAPLPDLDRAEPAKSRVEVSERSGAAIRDEKSLTIRALDDAEIVLVDLPPEA